MEPFVNPSEITLTSSSLRVLSGMRSTGRLHLGHLVGAIATWKHLIEQKNDCLFMVADLHALTTGYAETSQLPVHIRETVLGWLAAGLDPNQCTIFIQSLVPEHSELSTILSMFTPLAWLERNPTYKDQIAQLTNKEIETFGFLGYPVLQAADILIYRADAVPVGEDQVPHLELCREIARRVNFYHGGPIEAGTNRPLNPIFPEPEAILSEVPKLTGLDGRKMSKSYDNAIYFDDPAETVLAKVKSMLTDKSRLRKSDPGHPEDCTVCGYQLVFNSPGQATHFREGCRSASLGCMDNKKGLATALEELLGPMRERRAYYEAREGEVLEILDAGTTRARAIATETMGILRDRLGLPRSNSSVFSRSSPSE
jgi:tryptophanyl-tRNA synthetase